MDSPRHAARHPDSPCSSVSTHSVVRRKLLRPWILKSTVASGLLALLWLLLRSGTRPSRLVYPCQQAACGTAWAMLGPSLVATVLVIRSRVLGALRIAAGKLTPAALAVVCIVLVGVAAVQQEENVEILAPRLDYRPDVYLVNESRGPLPGRHGGVDDLIELMGMNDLKWHRSATVTVTSGPDGLIDRDDVVLIKINAQWAERGGTNTDVLRGVLRRIVEHPDGFTGEIVVADNGQGRGSLDRTENNAEDHHQSPLDLVKEFANEGWTISAMRWDSVRSTAVDEFSAGDMSTGYVVNPTLDPDTRIRVSYPKIETEAGTYLSYKYGVWSPESEAYDADRLVVINMPVLKTHSTYGITACVKNHMGLITNALNTDSHSAVGRGGMGSVLAEVRAPDINILDCTWILARPGSGPSASYAAATQTDQLVASTDPIALDVWATRFIMMPAIIENGYAYGTYHGTQDPDNPDSTFRRYLDRSMNELVRADIRTTNDYDAVQLHVWPTEEGQPFMRSDANGDGGMDVSDPVYILICLLLVDRPDCRACSDAADANDDGTLDVSDAITTLEWLFLGGPEPLPPGPRDCGLDPTVDNLTCSDYPPCGEAN